MVGIDDAIAAVGGIVSKAIDRIWPDPIEAAKAQERLLVMKENGELQRLIEDNKLLQGQMDINKVEAASTSVFVAGWRPFVGWVGGAALAYAAILEPLLRFGATMFGYHGMFPVIDTSITMQVLVGILGLGGMRTYEKAKFVA